MVERSRKNPYTILGLFLNLPPVEGQARLRRRGLEGQVRFLLRYTQRRVLGGGFGRATGRNFEQY
eukprot:9200185-Pyramimonas_sp.AAC.1